MSVWEQPPSVSYAVGRQQSTPVHALDADRGLSGDITPGGLNARNDSTF